MSVEINYAIATLSDWLKNLAPVFQPMKSKTNRTLWARFSRALSKLLVISWNFDCFITLFVPVVRGRSNSFSIGFSTVTSKLLLALPWG